jgi:hypothetical protein
MRTKIEIIYDEESDMYFSIKPDDPLNPAHPITFNAVLDLNKHIQRYEHDFWKEQHGQ